MTAKRTPRDHDLSIRALRAEALKCEKRAQEPFDRDEWLDKRKWLDWQFQKRARAAAMSIAAEHLASIVGAQERASRRKGGKT